MAYNVDSMKVKVTAMFNMAKAISLLIFLFAPIQGMSAPLLWFNPVSTEVKVGEEASIQLMAFDVGNLYGVDLKIGFDSTVLGVVDDAAGSSGVQILPGDCPSPDFVLINQTDNSTGTIEYAATSLSPSVPCPGGVILNISFTGLTEGKSNLYFTQSIIADSNGLPIAHSDQNAEISVISTDDGDDLLLLVPSIIASSSGQWVQVTGDNLKYQFRNSVMTGISPGGLDITNHNCNDGIHSIQKLGSNDKTIRIHTYPNPYEICIEDSVSNRCYNVFQNASVPSKIKYIGTNNSYEGELDITGGLPIWCDPYGW